MKCTVLLSGFLILISISFLSCSDDKKTTATDNDNVSLIDEEPETDTMTDEDKVDFDPDENEEKDSINSDEEEHLNDEEIQTDTESDTESDNEINSDEDTADDCSEYLEDDAVIRNGSFELWTGENADFWNGSKSELKNDLGNVIKYTKESHSCTASCQLINESDNGKRFTTAAQSLKAGEYICSYWVRGTGEIRNAFYTGDYSSYSGYKLVSSDQWEKVDYTFRLTSDVADTFELIFSVRKTDPQKDHIQLDDVVCERTAEFCDTITCEEWETCSNEEKKCVISENRCEQNEQCQEWENCNTATHYCELKEGRCLETADCDVNSPKPLCDTISKTCIEGDPCEGVICEEWKECNPDTGKCMLKDDRCIKTPDCLKTLPACDTANHFCVSAEHEVNMIPNGGFESWDTYDIPYYGEQFLPEFWYGLDFPNGDNTGSTEIDPEQIKRVEEEFHSGSYALQIQFEAMPADRFTSEAITFTAGNYSCHYFVKGKGEYRHRWYSSYGWGKDTEFKLVDSSNWVQETFDLSFAGSTSNFRLIFYVSNTDATKNHILIDDVVCTKNQS